MYQRQLEGLPDSGIKAFVWKSLLRLHSTFELPLKRIQGQYQIAQDLSELLAESVPSTDAISVLRDISNQYKRISGGQEVYLERMAWSSLEELARVAVNYQSILKLQELLMNSKDTLSAMHQLQATIATEIVSRSIQAITLAGQASGLSIEEARELGHILEKNLNADLDWLVNEWKRDEPGSPVRKVYNQRTLWSEGEIPTWDSVGKLLAKRICPHFEEHTDLSADESLSPPFLMIAWDPSVLEAADYANLVSAVGDLVRASGGTAVQRLYASNCGVHVGVGS